MKEIKEEAKDAIAEPFSKPNSVWKDFVEDTPSNLAKMLDQDISFSKIHKLVKQEDDKAALRKVLLKYYYKIKNIFMSLTGAAESSTLSLKDYTDLVNRSKILDRNVSLDNA